MPLAPEIEFIFVQLYTITGNAGVAGATVSFTGTMSGSVTADGSGNYSISVMSGTYTIIPSKAGYSFSPTSRVVAVSGSNVTGVNFTATPIVASKGKNPTVFGTIWYGGRFISPSTSTMGTGQRTGTKK
jgi:hypothetical protein